MTLLSPKPTALESKFKRRQYKGKNGQTPLHTAVRRNRFTDVDRYLAKGYELNSIDKGNNTPLIVAIEEGNSLMAVTLIQKGADIKAKNLAEITPLTITSEKDGYSLLHMAAQVKDCSTAALLLQAGANPNAQDKKRRTPLCFAITNKDFQMIRLLLRQGACMDICDSEGKTSLDRAIIMLNERKKNRHTQDLKHSLARFLILAGLETAQEGLTIFDRIEEQKFRESITQYKENIYETIRTYCLNTNLSDEEVRCFLFTSFKMLAWTKVIYSWPTMFEKTFQKLNIKEPLQSLTQLSIQFLLISHIKDALVSYTPENKIGSDFPIALQCSISETKCTNEIEKVCEKVSANYQAIKNYRAKNGITEEEIERTKIERVEALQNSSDHHKSLDTDLKKIEGFDYLRRIHKCGFNDKYFLGQWHPMIIQYTIKTLPSGLKACFQDEFVTTILQNFEKLYRLHQECQIHSSKKANTSTSYRP